MATFHPKRKCADVTATGQPCAQWAATGTRDFKCIRHTEDPNRTGGGLSIQGRQTICYCDAYADETGKPAKHKAGSGLCKVQVEVTRINGDAEQPPPPGPGLLPVPAATEIEFEGVEGEWATYLQLVATGARLKQAAAASGLTVGKVNKRKKADPAFADQFELAERLACDAVEDALYGLASGRYGIPNLEAIKLYLGNRNPERWKGDVRNIKVEGTVEHQVEYDTAGDLAIIEELTAKLTDRVRYLPPAPILARVLDADAEEPAAPVRETPLTKLTPKELGRDGTL